MITETQMEMAYAAALRSPDAGDLAKKVAVLLIQKTENFTKPARIYIGAGKEITGDMITDIYAGLHDMLSGNKHTMLTGILNTILGIQYRLSFSYSNERLVAMLADKQVKTFGAPEILKPEDILSVAKTASEESVLALKEALGKEHPLFAYL